ncbi:glycosyltransferase family 4 protein [Larkinella rosea]|uniref:Glycosyltransferase n=1 Tax=Larkinella rosea TaxID=2025312 RepID=A0A3P1BTT0_9BACT|nr:glycosyltransferase family 4 protein [Larkinella rosea]RRB04266.1 glycosyltransferase [Larkinella rosea]
MRIAIIQGAFLPVPPVRGGAVEKIWYRMGQEFAVMGHDVVHIGRSHPGLPEQEVVNGVTYVRIPGYETPSSLLKLKFLDLLYSIRAVKTLPDEVDVIVTNTFWAPFLLRGKRGKKVYVDVQRVPKGQMKFYRHVGVLRGCSPAISEGIRQELAPEFHHLVSYVPNPVPFDIKNLSINREKTLLFVGRLHPEKGVHVLLKAFRLLEKEQFSGWKLKIVGPSAFEDGGGGDAYYQELQQLSAGMNVEWIGPVFSDDTLITYYAEAGIFCYPAQEGSGDAAPVAPREAMAYGAVPVVSGLGCFQDFIQDDENGLYYDHTSPDQVGQLAQVLSALMNDENRLKRLSKQAVRVNTEYAIPVIAQRFMDDFRKIYPARKNDKNPSASVSI